MQKKIFGIVEGFFSQPLPLWSSQERLLTIKFLTREPSVINTYIYCPKDDQYVTKLWSKPYPEKQLTPILKAAALCDKAGVLFYYGLNPALTDFSEESAKNTATKVIAKLDQLRGRGIKRFCILFDDIPFAYNILASEKSSRDEEAGRAQAFIANAVYRWLNKQPESLLLCSSEYFFTKKTKFLSALDTSLVKNIPLIWTGDQVFAGAITKKMLSAARYVLKNRTIVWWDNYPANDCEHLTGTLHLGAFNGPPSNVFKNMGGIVVNPMRQASANLPMYETMRSYIKSPGGYDREKSLAAAYKSLFKDAGSALYHLSASFGDRNVADRKSRQYLQRNIAAIEMAEKPSNLLSGAYLSVVAPILLRRARSYSEILARVNLDKPVTEKILTPFIMFPVVIDIRYLTKIYNVVIARAKLLKDTPSSKLIREITGLTRLAQEYKNKNRLTIPSEKTRLFEKVIAKVISLQTKLATQKFNQLPQSKRLPFLIRWWQENGY